MTRKTAVSGRPASAQEVALWRWFGSRAVPGHGTFVRRDFAGRTIRNEKDSAANARFHEVWDRLHGFLETVDACDLYFTDLMDDRLLIVVIAKQREHVNLVASAIVQERRLLEEMGISRHDVSQHHDYIHINVSLSPQT